MLIIASFFAAVLPMLFYLLLIWKFDSYDREPFGLVLQNYLWGAFGAIILTLAASTSLSTILSFLVEDSVVRGHAETILIAPFVEEITKGMFLFVTVSNKKFDNITDGIVYGGAIGLGFGMTENFLYFISYGTTLSNWILLVIIRTLFSAVMHCVATATFGAFLGYAKFTSGILKILLPLLGMSIAMFIHFAWNASVSFESTAMLGFVFMIFTVAIFIVVFSVSLMSERKIIFRELFEESEEGLIPFEHLPFLNSSRRNSFGWVDENIRKLYIRAAITLAFRKMQYKTSMGFNRSYYQKEVDYYRNYIQSLLAIAR